MIDLRVVVDDCGATRDFLEKHPRVTGAIRSLEWHYLSRPASVRSGPSRVATLRKEGLSMVQNSFCAFLDDDNELEPEHYRRLECSIAESRSVAAHSWRSLWTRNGTPFRLTGYHPWSRDMRAAQETFDHYRRGGIYHLNSAIVRDQVIPRYRAVSMVDTSEWLFATSFLREVNFVTHYTYDDWLHSRAEDNKLLDWIVESGIPVPSTRTPSLRYYLGGYSNHWTQEGANIQGWVNSGL
jgi:hypothetical protein